MNRHLESLGVESVCTSMCPGILASHNSHICLNTCFLSMSLACAVTERSSYLDVAKYILESGCWKSDTASCTEATSHRRANCKGMISRCVRSSQSITRYDRLSLYTTMFTVIANQFMRSEQLCHLKRPLGFTLGPTGFLGVRKWYLEPLRRLLYHLVVNDIIMAHGVHTARVARQVLSFRLSISRLTLSEFLHILHTMIRVVSMLIAHRLA